MHNLSILIDIFFYLVQGCKNANDGFAMFYTVLAILGLGIIGVTAFWNSKDFPSKWWFVYSPATTSQPSKNRSVSNSESLLDYLMSRDLVFLFSQISNQARNSWEM